MTWPFALPAWVPWWVPLVLIVPALLWGLAFLLVPFSVIGVKPRLDGIEARLDELQAELRLLTLRLPEARHAVDFDEVYQPPRPAPGARRPPVTARPPIPPASYEPEGEETPTPGPGSAPPRIIRRPSPSRRDDRVEPRLDRTR